MPHKISELQKKLDSVGGGLGNVSERTAIQKQIDALKSGASTTAGYTPAYIKDPKTGKLIPSSKLLLLQNSRRLQKSLDMTQPSG
jgi:hypothetical protein